MDDAPFIFFPADNHTLTRMHRTTGMLRATSQSSARLLGAARRRGGAVTAPSFRPVQYVRSRSSARAAAPGITQTAAGWLCRSPPWQQQRFPLRSSRSFSAEGIRPPKKQEEEQEEEAAQQHKHPHHNEQQQPPPAQTTSAAPQTGLIGRNREFLATFTMVASVLCAIDCTVFPILLTILPAAEFFGGMDLHSISQKVALYVVMPIGSTTTLSNWLLHKNLPLAAMSVGGLLLIFGSNYPGLEAVLPWMQESRVYNTLGCALLVGSSWLAHRQEGVHDHGHVHGHGKEEKEEKEKEGCCKVAKRGEKEGKGRA